MHRPIAITALMAFTALLVTTELAAARTPAPDGAAAYIISPADGDTVSGPVTVLFGLDNIGVENAGVENANTGHHHLLIDVEELPDMNAPIPSDEHHVHFGGGQTRTTLDLAPGEHTLRLLLGDHLHRPHDPPVMSEEITITVE